MHINIQSLYHYDSTQTIIVNAAWHLSFSCHFFLSVAIHCLFCTAFQIVEITVSIDISGNQIQIWDIVKRLKLCGLINEWCINLILISFPEKNKEPIFSNSMNNHFVLGIMWQLTSLCLLVFFFFLLLF
jgi:hypothetical protein